MAARTGAIVPAGFWIRLVAAILDMLLLTFAAWVVQLMLMGLVYWARYLTGQALNEGPWLYLVGPADSLKLQLLNGALYLVLALPYYVIGHASYGTTLGKRPFGIYVVSASDYGPITVLQSIVRCLGYGLSYALAGVGFLMAAFHPEKRALHDLIAGTVSVRRRKGRAGEPATITTLGEGASSAQH